MSEQDDNGWDRVGAWLRSVIDDRGLSLGQVTRDSGVSYKSLRKLLDGQPIARRDRLATLALALGYSSDTFDRVRRGERARTTAEAMTEETARLGTTLDASPERRLTIVEEALAEVRAGLAEVVRRLDQEAAEP